ncbi:pilus assembly protein [Salinicola halophilus]|uniref:pilus assembly protein n=1 Tax=Salinicola halophilus TaxID=184065 RepID=UPI0013A6181D|nr:PilC/PilY family type IV pilus protein [Salinicola halophilus]
MSSRSIRRVVSHCAAVGLLWAVAAQAADDVAYYAPQSAQAEASPRSMLALSNDHQWFYKAYTDWSDLDGDGLIDATYKDSIEYYGYFDGFGCYQYDPGLAGGAFKRVGDADAKDHSCKGNKSWSGNLLNWATMTRIDVIRKALYGGKRYRDTPSDTTLLERAFLPMDSHSFSKILSDSNVINRNTPFNGKQSITFCNTTYHPVVSDYSGDVTDPPLIRVASRNKAEGWPLWASTERWQCPWRYEGRNVGWGDYPERDGGSSTAEYKARVEVCAENRQGCQAYPGSNHPKPVGLLHDYADDVEFGLFSGSYQNNKRGGVLRANFENFGNEFDAASGVFASDYAGIVSNLDALKIARYSYLDGNYNATSGDNCPWGKSSFNNGSCSNWGNPLAEIALETLRYITGETSPTSRFSVGTGRVEQEFIPGLTSPEWRNDIGDKWCAPHSLLVVNASEISFDGDDLGASSSTALTASAISAATTAIGSAEGVPGDYFIGQTSTSRFSAEDKFCTAKSLSSLADAQGLCPMAPGLEGTYHVAGLSRLAQNQSLIRGPKGEQGRPIDTYAVQLASNIPIIEIPIGGDRHVSLIPACANTSKGAEGKCAIVDFEVIDQAPDGSSGAFMIDWEDSEFGGDHDLDVEVALSYELKDQRLAVTTDVTRASASLQLGLGYILSGTSGRFGAGAKSNDIVVEQSDGFNAHSGINGFTYPNSICGNDSGCYSARSSTATYRVSGSTGRELETPLYYAAKYGNDGRTTSGSPSAYFEVDRIGELAESLRELLTQVLNNTNRSGAGIEVGYEGEVEDFVFQTVYNNQYSWSGDVRASRLDDSGGRESIWSARDRLPAPSARTIITQSTERSGMAFTSDALQAAYGEAFGDLPARADYLRGDTRQERRNGGNRRDRLWVNGTDAAKLGDFIGSRPYLVSVPNTYHVPDAGDTSYADYRVNRRDRRAMLYVGGNDGMLHGFDAETGVEKLAYVPGLILPALAELGDDDERHRYYVDGSPTVLDARRGDNGTGEWLSLLVSGLGSGAPGVFALDVTEPADFSQRNADAIALWEYGVADDVARFGGDSQLGHVYNRPSVVRLENDRYAVVFGNGPFNAAGKASLYVLYVDAGQGANGAWRISDVERLTPSGAMNAGDNGMSTVSLIDRDNNGRIDLAYGADLQGNVWRFDLSASDSASWAAGMQRLFTAERNGQRQVLTSTLEVGRHPDGGFMLFFGSGAQEGAGLPTSQSRRTADSFYAIRDYRAGVARRDPLTRTDLDARILSSGPLARETDSVTIRYLESVDTQRYPVDGWFLDFEGAERVVDSPSVRGNRILFSSLIPGHGMCGAEDSGFLFELNAWYGAAFESPVLDVNDDGRVDGEDRYTPDGFDQRYVPIGVATEGALFTPEVIVSDDGQQERKVSVNTQGDFVTIVEMPLNRIRLGRVSWRVLE